MAKVATDFDKIINAGRERKKNEALAARIFGKDNRRSSAPGRALAGGSLASRVGVQKRTSSATPTPAGNINGEWLHDLHSTRSTPNLRAQNQQQHQPKTNSLAARIHAPGRKPIATKVLPIVGNARNRAVNRASKLASAVDRSSSTQMNITQAPPTRGFTIRGLAGPYVVMAQNFAPGTTAADIESAMTPIGGIISSCRLIKSHPIVIAEVVFESKEGADSVIETLNNQTADGRVLHVYMKPGSGFNTAQVPTGPRAQRLNETRSGGNNVVVDGSNGFDEPMDGSGDVPNQGGLYSDRLVTSSSNNNNHNSRRGRGFQNRGRTAR